MVHTTGKRLDHVTSTEAKQALDGAERGDAAGAQALAEITPASPASVEAAEREAMDGPQGLGLAR